MKKLLMILMLTSLSLSACGGSDDGTTVPGADQPEPPGGNEDPVPPATGESPRYLVLYSSRTGTTERVAEQIRTELDCDVVEVVPALAYESDYNAMLDRAQQELAAIRQGSYPAIETSVESFEQYDIVFVGYPIWYGSMATPMQTFLHEHAAKLAGKRIALFATSGSSGISTSLNEAQGLCSDAEFTATLLLTSSALGQMASRVGEWLEQLGAGSDRSEDETDSFRVKITVGDRTAAAVMENNPTARDLLSRLPLEVSLTDYAGSEKIFYPSPQLTAEGSERGGSPVAGDIMLYEPWGNVAIFYEAGTASNSLIRMGRIEQGIELFREAGTLDNIRFERE